MKPVRFAILIVFVALSINVFGQTHLNELLLSNYRPKNIYNTPKAEITKPKFPIIDMHSHPYASSKEDLDIWVKNMDDLNIEKTILLTNAHGAVFDSLLNFYSNFENRFELWCGFDYTDIDKPDYGPEAIKELERCFKMGAKGIGELGDKGLGLLYCNPPAQGVHIDNPKLAPLLNKCAELGMPINIHVGEPQWFYEKMDSTNDGLMNSYSWRLDQQDGLNLEEVLKTLENSIMKHPNTIFIACHFANQNHDLNILGKLLDKYSNFYADISARYAEQAPIPRFTKSFIEKYNHKLFYGTDMGFQKSMYEVTYRILESTDEHFYEIDLFNYHWPLYGLGLNDESLKNIYKSNAVGLYKKLQR